MGLIKKLFGRREVSLRDLKLALLRVERERRRKESVLQKLEERVGDLFERTKRARRAGKQAEVDGLWEELKQARAEGALERRQMRVLNLEAITLKRTVWGMEHLESRKDRTAVRDLVHRLRASGLDDKLRGHDIVEEEYLRELEDILEDLHVPAAASGADEDPEKAAFLAEIDAINAAEELGEIDEAEGRESELKGRLATEEGGS